MRQSAPSPRLMSLLRGSLPGMRRAGEFNRTGAADQSCWQAEAGKDCFTTSGGFSALHVQRVNSAAKVDAAGTTRSLWKP